MENDRGANPESTPPMRLALYIIAIVMLGVFIGYPKYIAKKNPAKAKIPEAKIPVVLEYTSPDCGNCAYMKPDVVKLTKEFEDKAVFVEISIKAPNLIDFLKKYPASALPTFYILDSSRAVRARFEGIVNPDAIRSALETILKEESASVQSE